MSFVFDLVQNQLFWVLLLLVFSIWQFILNKLRMDIVALLVIAFFSLSGILTVQEVFAGLSDPNVVLIALLFIVGEGLVRTGIAYQVSDWLMRVSGASETRVLVLLMLCIAGLGSFMSSTGVVAIFIPVVLAICSGMGISPKRLMMPLSVAGLISGMMTLIATPPNLVAHSELLKAGFDGFSFFSFTPIGVGVLLLGIGYMIIARRWLDNGEQVVVSQTEHTSSLAKFIDEYNLHDKAKMVVINTDSPLAGKTIQDLNLRNQFGLNIVAILRVKHFRRVAISAFGAETLYEKDILLLDSRLDEETFNQHCQQFGLKNIALNGAYFSDHAKSVGMAEFSIMPEAESLGKTISELQFRSTYGLSVIGIKRDNQILHENIIHTPLKFGDVILAMGLWERLLKMDGQRDFYLLNVPEESKQIAPAISQAPYALFSVLTMVGLMISGIVPNVIAALIACLMLGKFRCVDMKSAYQSIHLPSLVLIVGMMPFSTALQKTGGVDLIVGALLDIMQGLDVHFVLIVLFVFTAIISAFISNTATAILVMPIAIAIAQQLNYSAAPFAMIVAISASAAFMTPVSSPVNTMVLAPGGYKFMDFVKVGVPFTILVMLLSVFAVPLLFPL